jgi:hypothetical protein
MDTTDWGTWLKQYNDLLLERLDRGDLPYYPPGVVQAVKAGWLGRDAGTEAEVQALETRLGLRLPPSYRQFLLTSNGFLQVGMLVPRLYALQEVDPFLALEKDDLESWFEWQADAIETYPQEDDTRLFLQHLQALIVISEKEEAGTARYILNPERINADGEWEAYYYAHWRPGAIRFESFWGLMQYEFEYLRDYVNPPA